MLKNEEEMKNRNGKWSLLVEQGQEQKSGNTTRNITANARVKKGIGVYEGRIKPALDRILSFGGLVFFSPLFVLISLAIVIDDPGPVFFKQKRIGKNKHYIWIHKFRSMSVTTPADVPTHQLADPSQYITRVGRILRRTSLDELPQIWDIFQGRMSLIGPRPALWNQSDLIQARDKYGANDIMPGLTGLAQINGRDELEISDKARLDGKYTKVLRNGGIRAFYQDVKCCFCTVGSVLKQKGVVEGGTGATRKMEAPVAQEAGFEDYGCYKSFCIDKKRRKKVLITGAGSYIGEYFKEYCKEHYPNIACESIDMVDGNWRRFDFGGYDTVFHVAAIAHADVGKTNKAEQERYYAVNTELAVDTAKKAKADGVRQFIFMSSMIIYGGKEYIDEKTVPQPVNFYGESKWLADKRIRELGEEGFHVAVLRPPMIYGKRSKGNYPILSRLAKKLPVFPDVENKRSMLYVENLCEFVALLSLSGESGVYFPQNRAYTKTADMVQAIGVAAHRPISKSKVLNPAVAIAGKIPGKVNGLVEKAFGDGYYDQKLSQYRGLDYQLVGLEESIRRAEGVGGGIHILLISQYFYPETFRVNDIAAEWVKRGYKVTVLTGIPNYPRGKFFDGYGYVHRRKETWNGVDIIRIPILPRGGGKSRLMGAAGMAANYISFVASGKHWVRKHNVGADLVFTVAVSPLTQALVGCWYGKRYHTPVFLYVQDLWPENIEAVTGIRHRAVIAPIDKMVDKIYRETDKVFTASPRFVEAIVNRKVPVNRKKVHYWPQYAEEFYRPMERRRIKGIPEDGSFRIAFTGNLGTAQGLDILPKTAEFLKYEAVKFVIVGDGRYRAALQREIVQRNVQGKFVFLPRQPAERIPYILGSCDAGFVSFNQKPIWEMTIPAKLQSYMACGKAVIASASGETKRIIAEADCGICCPIGDARALADGIKELMRRDSKVLGENARLYFASHFEKKKLMDEMDAMIGGKNDVIKR